MTSIESITDKLSRFTSAMEAAKAKSTVPAAEAALRKATEHRESLAAEDETISPAELVKRRRDAADAVEAAEISLDRSKRAAASATNEPWYLFREATTECAAALRSAGELHGPKFLEELEAVIGTVDFRAGADRWKTLAWHQSERFYGHARTVESASNPETAANLFRTAFEMIERGNR